MLGGRLCRQISTPIHLTRFTWLTDLFTQLGQSVIQCNFVWITLPEYLYSNLLFPTFLQLYIPINIPHTYWFLGALFQMTICDSHWQGGYCLENKDWFIGMRVRIHKLLLRVKYWGAKPTDSIPLECFKMTLEKALDVSQQFGNRGYCGVFLCWFLEVFITGKSISIKGKTTDPWAMGYQK